MLQATSNTQNGKELRNTSVIAKATLFVTLLFVFLIPWGNVIFDGFIRVFGMASLGLGLITLIVHGTHQKYSFFHLFFLMFGCWLVFSLMWSPDYYAGQESAVTVVQLVLISFLISLILDTKDKIVIAYQSYVLGVFIASSLILYNFLNGIQYGNDDRYSLINYEVDGISIILALSVPMSAYLVTQYKSKILNILNVVVIPLTVIAIFLTGTRTASIAAAVGIMYWFYTKRNANYKVKIVFIVFFVASVVVLFSFAPQDSVDRIFSSGKSLSSGNLNYRTVIWGASLDQWKESPIVGNGIGSLAYVLSPAHVQYGSAHNTFIQILTETGIVGFTLYIFILLSILYYIFKSPIKEDKAFMLALLLTALLCQLTMNTMKDKEAWFVLTMLAIHAHHKSKLLRR